jgi:hypothetical protein
MFFHTESYAERWHNLLTNRYAAMLAANRMAEADPVTSELNSRIERGMAAQTQEVVVNSRMCHRLSLFCTLIFHLPRPITTNLIGRPRKDAALS